MRKLDEKLDQIKIDQAMRRAKRFEFETDTMRNVSFLLAIGITLIVMMIIVYAVLVHVKSLIHYQYFVIG